MNLQSISPKGNQPKWANGRYFYKQDLFAGEGLSEYLVSLFLEASSCSVSFIAYRLDSPGVCKCLNYKPRYSMLPFAVILDRYIRKQDYAQRIINHGGNLFQYWLKHEWDVKSAQERATFVIDLLSSYGVSRWELVRYLTHLVELDTLVLNIDRHFNNFGLMYDDLESCYKPMFIFDNGLSLTTGAGVLGDFKSMLDLRKVKMQPFSSSVSRNRKALPSFKYPFSAKVFIDLLESTCPFTKEYLKSTNQFIALKRRLSVYYVKDKYGLNILRYFTESGY